MKKETLVLICFLTLLPACLKKIESESHHNNIFDPESTFEPWCKQSGIDSVHVGGIVYKFTLSYELTHPQLLNPVGNFAVGVKRNDSEIFGSTSRKNNTFSFTMFNQHRVGGDFCYSLCLRGENSGEPIKSFYDCFEY